MDEPNIVDKTKNFVGAMTNWVTRDGLSTLTPEQFFYRKQLCLSCPHWDNDGFGGIGKCKVCGCSVAKLYIPSSKCPDNPPRWLNISASYTPDKTP